MVLGYMCEEHGFRDECDVDDGGQRICTACGMAVTGVTGTGRGRNAPPSDDPTFQQGDIQWWISTGYGSGGFTVEAFDIEHAVSQAVERVDNPQEIREVQPKAREYRRH